MPGRLAVGGSEAGLRILALLDSGRPRSSPRKPNRYEVRSPEVPLAPGEASRVGLCRVEGQTRRGKLLSPCALNCHADYLSLAANSGEC
jgi:hypothetical protein